MKSVEIAFILLVFNICMGFVSLSGISTYTPYYESEVINQINDSTPANVSITDESEQYTTSMNVFTVITSVVSFNWLYMYSPEQYDAYLAPIVIGLNVVMGFFSMVAIIEFFMRRSDVLGGSSK